LNTPSYPYPLYTPLTLARQAVEKELLVPFQDAFKGGVSALEHGQSVHQGVENGFKNGVKSVEAAAVHAAGALAGGL
jgi:hypothetical protein